jgi:predicted phosphohydrolase
MRFFAISDLHLSFTSNKPMDKFGQHWYLHHEKIERSWRAEVNEDDIVLIPGDHSWAMKLDEALPDLQWIAALPGTKVMGKGNHDLWWHSLARLEGLGLPATRWLQNNAMIFADVGIVGTRGWSFPRGGDSEEDQQDEKIYRRELERLKLSYQALAQQRKKTGAEISRVICMLHYPPLLADRRDTEFTRLMEENGTDVCVYGHMHLSHKHRVFRGAQNGIRYDVVSCDFNDFAPLLIHEAAQVPA